MYTREWTIYTQGTWGVGLLYVRTKNTSPNLFTQKKNYLINLTDYTLVYTYSYVCYHLIDKTQNQ